MGARLGVGVPRRDPSLGCNLNHGRRAVWTLAFTYYRRVIENQKSRIFDRILSVAKTLGVNSLLISELEDAKNETRFSDAVGKQSTLYLIRYK